MRPQWVARLRLTEPGIVNLVAADEKKPAAFRKLVSMVRQEEGLAAEPRKRKPLDGRLLTVLTGGHFSSSDLTEIVSDAEEYYRRKAKGRFTVERVVGDSGLCLFLRKL
jgi:hypothetical protein